MSLHSQFSAALLTDVMRPVASIASSTSVTEIASIFTSNAAVLMIPVCGDSGFEGVISRRDLFSRHLARKFAVELYGNKPISLLINRVFGESKTNALLFKITGLYTLTTPHL